MKNRMIGLKMCIISIIMITLCIPNQMEIAKAAEGDNTDSDAKVIFEEYSEKDNDYVECKTDDQGNLQLNIFPVKDGDKSYSIAPGDHDVYKFKLINKLGYPANYQIRLHAYVTEKDSKVTTEHDDSYPIKYDLRNATKDDTKNVFEKEVNPFDYKFKNEDGSISENTVVYEEKNIAIDAEMEYELYWNFEQVDKTFEGGQYHLELEVWYEQAIDTPDPDPTPTPTPDPDPTPDKPDNPGDNNNNNNSGGNNSGNNSGDNNSGNNNSNSGNNGSNSGNNSSDSDNNGSNSNGNSNGNNSSGSTNASNSSNGSYGTISANKKKVNTSDMTTPVVYAAVMILSFGLILIIKSRNAK